MPMSYFLGPDHFNIIFLAYFFLKSAVKLLASALKKAFANGMIIRLIGPILQVSYSYLTFYMGRISTFF